MATSSVSDMIIIRAVRNQQNPSN